MKTKLLIILLLTIVFPVLFYNQGTGINYLIFTLILIFSSTRLYPEKSLEKPAVLLYSLSFLSVVPVVLYGNMLSISVNWIFLSVLCAKIAYPYLSVMSSLLYTQLAFIGSPVLWLIKLAEPKITNEKTANNKMSKTITIYALPVIITLFFVALYHGANAAFAHLVDRLNLDFITPELIVTLFLGWIIAWVFTHPFVIDSWYDIEKNKDNSLVDKAYKPRKLFDTEFSQTDEIKSGVFLLALLNLLIMIVNVVDINYLLISKDLPEGMNYSAFLHQGIGQLIFSILIAISIILFYFRGANNFSPHKKTITAFAYLWIIQNVVMVLLNLYKNQLYVNEFTLTYKRVGVYFYLLLTVAGLVLTAYKILKKKNNFFLFRANGWAIACTFLLAAFANWDVLITRFNIYYSKSIDKDYLIRLSDDNIPLLIELYNNDIRKKEITIDDGLIFRSSSFFYDDYESDFGEQLKNKVASFLKRKPNKNFLSWNYADARTYHFLMHLKKDNRIVLRYE